MRTPTVVALFLLIAACSQPVAGPGAAASPSATANPSQQVASCRLPVYWVVNDSASTSGVDIHAAFVSVPEGTITDAGIFPAQSSAGGATFLAGSNKWVGVARQLVSPDGTRYAYWKGTPAANEVHVVDVATGADRTLYSGPELYIVIAFESDGIYLVHAVNPRQGAFELLFRLDPAGGPITLVAGSDRHMYQWGWVLISDGAAWGIDNRVQGEDYFYSILRLDLVTGQVTKWFESPLGDFSWPLGTDLKHRLYVQGVSGGELWRVTAAGRSVQLSNPGPIGLADFMGVPTAFVADSRGAWMTGPDGVWLYGDGADPKHFVVGPSGGTPAGPCL